MDGGGLGGGGVSSPHGTAGPHPIFLQKTRPLPPPRVLIVENPISVHTHSPRKTERGMYHSRGKKKRKGVGRGRRRRRRGVDDGKIAADEQDRQETFALREA